MKNNARLKMVLWMVAFAMILCLVAGLLHTRLDNLFYNYVSSQVSRQSAIMAELVDEKVNAQLEFLAGISREIEKDSLDFSLILQNFQMENKGSYGMLNLKGDLVAGDSDIRILPADFTGIVQSFHGNDAVSFNKEKGFLFSVPVYHGRNVRYVLYKLYSEREALEYFDNRSYNGECYFSIRNVDGQVIVGSMNKELSESSIWQEGNFDSIRVRLKKLLNVSVASALRETVDGVDYFFFMADLKMPGLSLVGMVPASVAANGVDNITFLIFWVFGTLLVLFLIGFVFVFVSERKSEENESLREAKILAEKASLAKSQFLANMSHEVRTPINGILGMDTMLLKECKDPVLKEYALNIQSAGQTLLSIINDILDISKIESGKMEIVPVEYDLFSVLNECRNMVAMRASEKSLDLRVEVDKSLPSGLMGDEVRLRQIINNLLSNAVKYTHSGNVILRVSYEHNNGGTSQGQPDVRMINLIVAVQDTGIGIRSEDVDKLFMSFQRLDERRNRNIEGAGLGLNLTKSLVDLMGGDIQVESEYGKGSTFIVAIPQIVKRSDPIGDFNERYNRVVNTDIDRNRFRAPNANVLVVDDVPMNLRVMNGLLKETQILIDTAYNGMEALERIKRKRYDVIFLDHMMPVMDGMETVSLMRSLSGHPNETTPVIMLTANADKQARDLYLQSGFSDYLSKPIREADLLEVLLKYLPSDLVEMVDQAKPVKEPKTLDDFYKDPVVSMPLASSEVNEAEKKNAKIVDVMNISKDLADLSATGFVDVGIGLGYCMNDEKFYREMLSEFAKSNRELELKSSLKEGDYESYRICVHSLKSTSLTIGAVEFSSRAKAMEFACKDGHFDYVQMHHDELMAEYRNFLKVLADFARVEEV